MRQSLSLMAAALFSAPFCIAAEERTVCGINLFFTHDEYGPAAEYHLTTQFTNRTGRAISGISAVFFDANESLIGNAELNCELGRPPLHPGSTGQCSALLQTIDGKMMEKFGTTMWTDIVNIQLQRLNSITSCNIEGYRYTLDP
ncbi:MAG: hypothetical protein ACPHI0_00625 [Paracoccaceae bacterium]|jgi:hypothetical protein